MDVLAHGGPSTSSGSVRVAVRSAPLPEMKRDGGSGRTLLTSSSYVRFLAETHPRLQISEDRFGLPSFVAALDIREPIKPGRFRGMVRALTEITPFLVVPRSLFLGTPFERFDQSYLLAEVEEPYDLREEAARYAQKNDLEMVVMTNVSARHPAFRRWVDAGFVSLPSFPDTIVNLDVASFDAHLLRLPQGDRSGVRRNIRRFEKCGHRLERVHDSRTVADALFASYWPMYERATVRWQPHTRAYFEGLTGLGPDVWLTAAKSPDGEVMGFIVNFMDGSNFQAGRVGVRPQWHRKDGVYFRLMYHAIEEAIRLGGQTTGRLSLEPTGYRMKRHLGAWRQPLVNLVYGVSGRWNALLSGFAGLGRHLLRHLDDEYALEQVY